MEILDEASGKESLNEGPLYREGDLMGESQLRPYDTKRMKQLLADLKESPRSEYYIASNFGSDWPELIYQLRQRMDKRDIWVIEKKIGSGGATRVYSIDDGNVAFSNCLACHSFAGISNLFCSIRCEDDYVDAERREHTKRKADDSSLFRLRPPSRVTSLTFPTIRKKVTKYKRAFLGDYPQYFTHDQLEQLWTIACEQNALSKWDRENLRMMFSKEKNGRDLSLTELEKLRDILIRAERDGLIK